MSQAAPNLVIRTVQPDDAEAVAALLVELGYPDNGVDQVRQRLTMWAREATSVALVVAAACRGQGVGRRLVEAAEAAAAGYGCTTMEVTSARRRTESHAFYRRLGYEEWCDRSACYLKDLVPGASSTSYGARPSSVP